MSELGERIRHGLPLEYDLPIAARPEDPHMRDGVNVWLFEENGAFGIPRIAVDAVGESWDTRTICANFAFPGGRILDGRKKGIPAVPAADAKGKPSVLGSKVLTFQCIEPFRKWRMSYDDTILDGTIVAQIARKLDPAKLTRVRVQAEIALQIPVWSQVFSDDDPRPAADWMGRGWRYETPVKAEGTLEIDGKQRSFRAIGTLVRRKSKRAKITEMYGHTWEAAIFPDGRAFGMNVYPLRDDRPQYNTGYIYKDGKFYDAKVVEVEWLGPLVTEGDDCSLALESELGVSRISGKSLLTTYVPESQGMGGLNLHQGGAKYTWDDQVAIGMIERSAFPLR